MIKERKERALHPVDAGEQHMGETFGTVQNLLRLMERHNIPLTAQIIYMGCGTHTVGLEWIEEVPEPFEISIETQLKHDYMMGTTPDE